VDQTPEQFFTVTLAERMAGNPDRAKKIGGVFEFVLDGDNGGTWTLDLNAPTVVAGKAEKMNVRIRMKAENFLAIVAGTMNEMQAFTQGLLKVEGNIAMALKLREVLSAKGW
jgi:sterol carrier protein 2